MNINKQGHWGEIYAARYMQKNGYDLMAAGFRCREGELDIVAFKGNYLCFVEVKARSAGAISEPREAVDTEKQRKIIASAKIFSQRHPHPEQDRFDVCEVYLDENMQPVKINYIENAFNG